MTFADLKTELVARGASNDTTRNGQWINQAYRKIHNAYDWPFAEVSATGSAGAGTVTVSSLRKVEYVGDVTGISTFGAPGRRLHKITRTELVEEFGVEDLDEAGTPEYWYRSGGTVIKAYPLGGTIHVSGYGRASELTGTDSPPFDEEYHLLIVDRAMVYVYNDADEHKSARERLAQFQLDLIDMAKDYMVYSREGSYIQVVDPRDG